MVQQMRTNHSEKKKNKHKTTLAVTADEDEELTAKVSRCHGVGKFSSLIQGAAMIQVSVPSQVDGGRVQH